MRGSSRWKKKKMKKMKKMKSATNAWRRKCSSMRRKKTRQSEWWLWP